MSQDSREVGKPETIDQQDSGRATVDSEHSSLEPSASQSRPKVIVPRLVSRTQQSGNPSRSARACDRCKFGKKKCSGNWPCTVCTAEGKDCVYSDNKRERQSRLLASSVQRNETLTSLVGRLRGERNELLDAVRVVHNTGLSDANRAFLAELIAKYEQDDDSVVRSPHISGIIQHDNSEPTASDIQGEKFVSIDVGSPNSQGKLSSVIHLARGEGASGLIGKLSEISWLERARDHLLEGATSDISSTGSPGHAWLEHADFSYHVDEADLLSIDEEFVDEYHWPSMAVTLAGIFFDALYPTFPFVDKKDFFLEVSRSHPFQENTMPDERRRHLATANMIFGLGAKWLLQGTPNTESGRDDHLMYYARARKLGLDHRVILDHPTVAQVQALGLLGLYLTMNHQYSRAWTAVGQSLRHAVALGMHLAVDDAPFFQHSNRNKASTWYALYNLEIFLVETTGRPTSMISDIEITVPRIDVLNRFRTTSEISASEGPPSASRASQSKRSTFSDQSFDQFSEQHFDQYSDQHFSQVSGQDTHKDFDSSLDAYFSRRTNVSRISRRIAATLYAGGLSVSWAEFQDSVRSFELEIQHLAAFVFDPSRQVDSTWLLGNRHNLELALSIHSLQMILYRPFLCDWEGKIKDESSRSQAFNQEKACAAIVAAKSMLALIFSVGDTRSFPSVLPCWSTLHYLCQAGAILVLELTLNTTHLPSGRTEILGIMRTLIAHLQAMSSSSYSANKAWMIFSAFLHGIESSSE